MRQRGRLAGIAAILGALFLLSALSTAMAGDLTFKVAPKKLKKAGPVLFFASGLKPGQEVGVRTMMGGVLSDVSFLAKPSFTKADKNGAVASVWTIRGRTLKRLLKNGTYNVDLVDADGKTLASAKLTVAVEAKKKKKKK
jgi:hypothetical protein